MNTIKSSSRVMKTFKFSLVLRTRENTDVFISLDDNIYGIHSKRINILYVLLLKVSVKYYCSQRGSDESSHSSWNKHPCLSYSYIKIQLQSTLVISKSKGLSEILRNIRSSTYQICRIEEKKNRTTTFYKWICNLTPEVRDKKILWKRKIAPEDSPLFHIL